MNGNDSPFKRIAEASGRKEADKTEVMFQQLLVAVNALSGEVARIGGECADINRRLGMIAKDVEAGKLFSKDVLVRNAGLAGAMEDMRSGINTLSTKLDMIDNSIKHISVYKYYDASSEDLGI